MVEKEENYELKFSSDSKEESRTKDIMKDFRTSTNPPTILTGKGDSYHKFHDWDIVKTGTETHFEKEFKEKMTDNEIVVSSDSDFNFYDFEDVEREFDDKTVTKSMLKKMSIIRKKPFAKRVFRNVGEGSIRGSVFTLFSGAVGAGVLSLPKVVSYYGLGLGLLIIVLNALLAYASYWA